MTTSKISTSRFRHPLRRGLSLVELLVAMAIILLLVSILLVIGRALWNAVMKLKGDTPSSRPSAALVQPAEARPAVA